MSFQAVPKLDFKKLIDEKAPSSSIKPMTWITAISVRLTYSNTRSQTCSCVKSPLQASEGIDVQRRLHGCLAISLHGWFKNVFFISWATDDPQWAEWKPSGLLCPWACHCHKSQPINAFVLGSSPLLFPSLHASIPNTKDRICLWHSSFGELILQLGYSTCTDKWFKLIWPLHWLSSKLKKTKHF